MGRTDDHDRLRQDLAALHRMLRGCVGSPLERHVKAAMRSVIRKLREAA
jgi:hypothetical protein